MRNIKTILKKELQTFFNTPVAYIVLTLFLVFSGVVFFFLGGFLQQNFASLRSYFTLFPILFSIFVPALSMGMWTGEFEKGTFELLASLPVKESELVVGKFLSLLVLLAGMLALTLFVPAGLSVLGNFESGEIIGEYIGCFLLGSAYSGIGLLMSMLTRNQISAFLLSFAVLISLSMVGAVNQFIELPGIIRDFIVYISIDTHFASFSKGLLDSRDILYFLILTAASLYINIKLILLRKWG